ncbi:MAG TPA: prolipoprotein diacylglyceryl transferase family protein [Xanthobacteraceae bacterium]|jgi:prolipoprotein diacylglyceryltransferase
MSSVLIHGAFDVLAWAAAALAALWLTRIEKVAFPAVTTDLPYLAALLLGAGMGAYVFGTANLWLSGAGGIARSIEGAVAGGIIAVEIYKRSNAIRARTGARFALPFCVGVAIGRIGCYLAGLDDFTYGTPTTLPWGHDFGDGVARHPVQLYEAAAMAAFAAFYVAAVRLRDPFVIDNGFYLAVGFYGMQRFGWEFIKPYGALLGPFSVFHFLSAALVVYACAMLASARKGSPSHDRAVA